MTQTLPLLPLGADAFIAPGVFVPFAAAGVAAAELAAAPEVFGLNKSPSLNLPGEGDGAG